MKSGKVSGVPEGRWIRLGGKKSRANAHRSTVFAFLFHPSAPESQSHHHIRGEQSLSCKFRDPAAARPRCLLKGCCRHYGFESLKSSDSMGKLLPLKGCVFNFHPLRRNGEIAGAAATVWAAARRCGSDLQLDSQQLARTRTPHADLDFSPRFLCCQKKNTNQKRAKRAKTVKEGATHADAEGGRFSAFVPYEAESASAVAAREDRRSLVALNEAKVGFNQAMRSESTVVY